MHATIGPCTHIRPTAHTNMSESRPTLNDRMQTYMYAFTKVINVGSTPAGPLSKRPIGIRIIRVRFGSDILLNA